MKTLTFIIAILIASPHAKAENGFYEYDLHKEENRWGMTKDCANKVHKSLTNYCEKHFDSANLECTQARHLSFPEFGENRLNMSATLQQKDMPRRGVLAFIEISDIKNCVYDIRNLR